MAVAVVVVAVVVSMALPARSVMTAAALYKAEPSRAPSPVVR